MKIVRKFKKYLFRATIIMAILLGFFIFPGKNARAEGGQEYCTEVEYFDADTGEVIYTGEKEVVELVYYYFYEPSYTFVSEEGEEYILDVDNEKNVFCATELEQGVSVYYKKGKPAEGKTAVKIKYQTGGELVGFTYMEGLNIGDSFIYNPEEAFQTFDVFLPLYDYFFKTGYMSVRLSEEKESTLTIDSLSSEWEENIITVCVDVREEVIIGNLVIRYCIDVMTGETLVATRAERAIGLPYQYTPLEYIYTDDGKIYEFDSDYPGNVLTLEAGDPRNIRAYYRRVLNVSFNPNGGTCTETSKKVKEGLAYGMLPSAMRDGYTFEGWYTAKDGGSKITQDAKVNLDADQMLYARWSENVPDKPINKKVLNISFNPNGGTCTESSKIVKEGLAYGTLPVPTRKGYTFGGWYTAKDGGSKITQDTKVNLDADQTLYARWLMVSVKRVSLQKPVNKRIGKMKITWKKVSGADGYQVTYAANKSFRKARKKTVAKRTMTVRKLKKGKTYYVKVRAYKLDSAGENVYGAYSKVKKIAIKR